MNVCVVSTFEGTTEDYMNMFNSTKESAQGFMVDYELGVIREGKVMLMIVQSAGLRQLAITFQPASRKASAESRPMPLEHPVIKIDFMVIAFFDRVSVLCSQSWRLVRVYT